MSSTAGPTDSDTTNRCVCGFIMERFDEAASGEALYACVYDESAFETSLVLMAEAAAQLAEVLQSIGAVTARRRDKPDQWSPIEYGCHVRDVLIVQRERVLRTLRGYGGQVLPMGRDERVEHDGYNDQDRHDVAQQIIHANALLENVFHRLEADQWALEMSYTFPTQSMRPLRWVAVHTSHEVVHHLHDVRTILDKR